MGTDKALLNFSGGPLILHIAEKIGVFGPAGIVGDPAVYSGFGYPVVPDNFPGAGPLAGIEAVLASTSSEYNLIVACDMPSLDEKILECLFGGEADCTLPRYPDGQIEPLCAVYHRRCHPFIRAALEQGIRKVTDALATVTVRYIAVDCRQSFTNLNTPEDLDQYRHG